MKKFLYASLSAVFAACLFSLSGCLFSEKENEDYYWTDAIYAKIDSAGEEDDIDARVVVWRGEESTETWHISVDGATQSTTCATMLDAINTGFTFLTSGRTSKEKLLVKSSGESKSLSDNTSVSVNSSISSDIAAINIPSYTVLDFGGNTLDCNGGDGEIVGIQAKRSDHISIRNANITGAPRYGIWLQGCNDVILNNLNLDFDVPETYTKSMDAIRIAWAGGNADNPTTRTTNIYIDKLSISGTGTGKHLSSAAHGLEFYDADYVYIGTVNVSDTTDCGVLLNGSSYVYIVRIVATNCSPRSDKNIYAGLRCANSNGPEIHVRYLTATNCGRGFFSCTGSNGCTIEYINVTNPYAQGILLQSAKNNYILSGSVTGSTAYGVHIVGGSGSSSEEESNSLTVETDTTNNHIENLTISGFENGIYEYQPSASYSVNYNYYEDNNLSGCSNPITIVGANSVDSGNHY